MGRLEHGERPAVHQPQVSSTAPEGTFQVRVLDGAPTVGSLALPTARINSVTTSPRFLSLDDVAKELNISRAQMYSLVRSGELPAIQVGPKRVWRIERARLEEYIERQYAAVRAAIQRGEVPRDEAHGED